jgi:hypothetical protein
MKWAAGVADAAPKCRAADVSTMVWFVTAPVTSTPSR